MHNENDDLDNEDTIDQMVELNENDERLENPMQFYTNQDPALPALAVLAAKAGASAALGHAARKIRIRLRRGRRRRFWG